MSLEKPTVIYRDTCARNIVFRDTMRRQQVELTQQERGSRKSRSPSPSGSIGSKSSHGDSEPTTPKDDHRDVSKSPSSPTEMHLITALPSLDLSAKDIFEPLLSSDAAHEEEQHLHFTDHERYVMELFEQQRAVIKTIRHGDLADFLNRFKRSFNSDACQKCGLGRDKSFDSSRTSQNGESDHDLECECMPSFRTSTTMLPPAGKKMRPYGSQNEFSSGVVFALPKYGNDSCSEQEDNDVIESKSWIWPSGYSAKTEFNIDNRGNLINGRHEAQVSLSTLRKYNLSYLQDEDYIVGGRVIKGGLNVVPYNELYLRVGGKCAVHKDWLPSYFNGIGTFVALFCRSASYKDLVSLLRTRARIKANLGEDQISDIPLLFITPENGVKVFTEELQSQFYKIMANHLNPFQNSRIQHKTMMDSKSKAHLDMKMLELLDLNELRSKLTREECASIAGGFGATDDSVAQLLMEVLHDNTSDNTDCNITKLQRVVNEGLVAAVRAADYHTSRQLLILYSLVVSRGFTKKEIHIHSEETKISERSDLSHFIHEDNLISVPNSNTSKQSSNLDESIDVSHNENGNEKACNETKLSPISTLPRPPPPPLDTNRLRYATNSDGLLAVLGAAEVLKSIQDGSIQKRVAESVKSIEEWVANGEQSLTFRLSSWRDQRTAQGDLKIAFSESSHFSAFIGTKAISNRKIFSQELAKTIAATEFNSVAFLQKIHEIVTHLHSPCLRLEILQYILGLDNRYSVAHVARSVELAATCLNISMYDECSE